MPVAPRVAFVVSHTHWDREWYLTYHELRARLTLVVRRALDLLEAGGAFRHFLLDGQAIVVEDHLAVHPEDAPRIRSLAQRGALALGPWYVLPDELLVSAESTVRNLLIGHKVAALLRKPGFENAEPRPPLRAEHALHGFSSQSDMCADAGCHHERSSRVQERCDAHDFRA